MDVVSVMDILAGALVGLAGVLVYRAGFVLPNEQREMADRLETRLAAIEQRLESLVGRTVVLSFDPIGEGRKEDEKADKEIADRVETRLADIERRLDKLGYRPDDDEKEEA